jgi:hypothetical protein
MIISEDIEKRLLKQKGKGKLGSDRQGGSKSHQLDKQTNAIPESGDARRSETNHGYFEFKKH